MPFSLETDVEKLTETPGGAMMAARPPTVRLTPTNTMARSHWSELESFAETQSVIDQAPQGSLG